MSKPDKPAFRVVQFLKPYGEHKCGDRCLMRDWLADMLEQQNIVERVALPHRT